MNKIISEKFSEPFVILFLHYQLANIDPLH